jgi:hypothetical protein
LLVTNETCHDGTCDTLQVLGFPDDQPRIPAGLWSIGLGTVTTAQRCLVFPASASFYDKVWVNTKLISIGVAPLRSNLWQARPSTSAFVPATAAGWRLTVPTGSAATTTPACASDSSASTAQAR